MHMVSPTIVMLANMAESMYYLKVMSDLKLLY